MHSTISDGTDTPEELLSKVKAAGIGLFSLTDHDAIAGAGMVKKKRGPDDPLFISGVEFSCRDIFGKYHILGYGYDPEASAIRAIVDEGHAKRSLGLAKRPDGGKYNLYGEDADVKLTLIRNKCREFKKIITLFYGTMGLMGEQMSKMNYSISTLMSQI